MIKGWPFRTIVKKWIGRGSIWHHCRSGTAVGSDCFIPDGQPPTLGGSAAEGATDSTLEPKIEAARRHGALVGDAALRYAAD